MARTGTPRPGPRHTNDSRIAQARIAAGLTQQELAERMGLKSFASIAAWELGKYSPKISTLQRIAQALNVPLNQLIE